MFTTSPTKAIPSGRAKRRGPSGSGPAARFGIGALTGGNLNTASEVSSRSPSFRLPTRLPGSGGTQMPDVVRQNFPCQAMAGVSPVRVALEVHWGTPRRLAELVRGVNVLDCLGLANLRQPTGHCTGLVVRRERGGVPFFTGQLDSRGGIKHDKAGAALFRLHFDPVEQGLGDGPRPLGLRRICHPIGIEGPGGCL